METKIYAVRNEDCDFDKRYCVSIEDSNDVLDYVYFDTENDAFQFISYYNFKH